MRQLRGQYKLVVLTDSHIDQNVKKIYREFVTLLLHVD